MFSHIECLSYLNMGYSGEENRTVVFIPKLSPATLLKNRIFKCPSTLTLPLLGPMHTPHTVVAVVFQSPCHVQLFVTPRTAARQASLSFTTSWSLLNLTFIESMMPSNHLILCHPLLLPPSIFPSIRVFSNDSVLHIRCPKYWNFSFSISPSNEYSGLISFRMDWLDLLAVQGTLKSLLQHQIHNSNS